jgi:hypothetical protein
MKAFLFSILLAVSMVAPCFGGGSERFADIGGNDSVQTSATGANYVTLTTNPARVIHIINDSGTTIEVRQNAAGVTVPIASGTGFSFFGIYNANELSLRRVDVSGTQVTLKYRWER